jgi:hypothetical protein
MEGSESKGGWLATLSQYAAWIVTTAGAVIDALAVREAVLAILAWVKVIKTEAYHQAGGVGEDILTNFGLAAVDYAVVFILSIIAVGFTIWFEYYFRKGREQGLLYKRIIKVVVAEIAIIIGAILVRVIIANFLI